MQSLLLAYSQRYLPEHGFEVKACSLKGMSLKGLWVCNGASEEAPTQRNR